MIEKIDDVNIHIRKKINEIIDAVNELQLAKDVMFNRLDMLNNAMCDMRIAAENGKSSKIEQDPYAEQRWVGCLCKLWTGDGLVRYGILRGVALNRKKTKYPYQALSTSFEHCEPVKPDDDIIYKGGDNE